jgi:hypothetical protein
MTTLRLNPALAKACHLPERPRSAAAVPRPPSGNALGDWALALVHTRPQKLVIAVSNVTHWAFCLPYAPMPTLQSRFGPALLQALLSLGVPPDRARAEVDHSEPWVLGRGIERSAVGHLTQYRHSVTWAAGEGLSLGAINARLEEKSENWRAAYDHAQAQIGRDEVHIPVALALPDEPRLEAAHQASILLMRLPHDDSVSGPPGRTSNPGGRWIPRTLIVDFADVDCATATFARALLDEVATLGVSSLHLANAVPAVIEAFEEVSGRGPARTDGQ